MAADHPIPKYRQHKLQVAVPLASQAVQGDVSETMEDGVSLYVSLNSFVCVCVCVCEREREILYNVSLSMFCFYYRRWHQLSKHMVT